MNDASKSSTPQYWWANLRIADVAERAEEKYNPSDYDLQTAEYIEERQN